MTISELKSMNEIERTIWIASANSTMLKEVLNNENLGGGISKFKKADLMRVVLELIHGIVSELTKQLKPKKIRKTTNESRKVREIAKPIVYNNNSNTNQDTSTHTKNRMTQEEIWYKEFMDGYPIFRIASMNQNNFSELFRWDFFAYVDEEQMSRQKMKYRKMVKYFHPDNKETGDVNKFREIQEAWQVAEEEYEARKRFNNN